jgi:hypothetical protein
VVVVAGAGVVVVGAGVAGGATVVVGAGVMVVVVGRLPGLGNVTTGRGGVVTGAAVFVGEPGTVVGVTGFGTVVVGAMITPRRGPGGTIAGLLAALTSLPIIATSSHRSGLAGASSTFASVRPSSFLVVVGSSNSISFSMGAFSPSGSWRQVIL